MNERWLVSSFTASSLIHLGIIPLAALIMHAKPIKPATVPIELVDVPRVEEPKKIEVAPPPPPAPKPKNITAPKLLSKPVLETKPVPPPGTPKKKSKKSRSSRRRRRHCRTTKARPTQAGISDPKQAKPKAAPPAPAIFSAKATRLWSAAAASKAAVAALAARVWDEAPRATAPAAAVPAKALSGIARPLGGYQVKPRYPESARRAGVQGVTTLRVRVLENGRVCDVIVEQSAGFRDLDLAAMDAVKKWLFEPARRGKEAVSVWVMLPVKFELH